MASRAESLSKFWRRKTENSEKNELITINIASFGKVYSWSIWRKAGNDSPKNSYHPLSNFHYALEHCKLVFVSLGFVTFYQFQQNVRLFFRLQTQTINPIKFSILRSLLCSKAEVRMALGQALQNKRKYESDLKVGKRTTKKTRKQEVAVAETEKSIVGYLKTKDETEASGNHRK